MNQLLVDRRRYSPVRGLRPSMRLTIEPGRRVALESEQLGTSTPPEPRPLAPLGVIVVEAAAERALVVGGARQVHGRHAQHDDAQTADKPERCSLPAAPRFRRCLSRSGSRPRGNAWRTRGPSRRPVMPGDYTRLALRVHRCGSRQAVDNRRERALKELGGAGESQGGRRARLERKSGAATRTRIGLTKTAGCVLDYALCG
jgi:hypothetical protein